MILIHQSQCLYIGLCPPNSALIAKSQFQNLFNSRFKRPHTSPSTASFL